VRVFPTTTTFDDWLLDETFDTLDPNAWTFVDRGALQGPSQWQLSDGWLQQTSGIHDGVLSEASPEKDGTYALGGNLAWSDYRVIVRLAAFDPDAIGIMFRYADDDNYYRLSMDSGRHYRRLIKKVNGVTSVLWEDDFSYTGGRDYLITLDCVGERLTGHLDGVSFFALDDADLTHGQIGLYCWSNEDARFAEVRVVAPVWANYHQFAHEDTLPAGTRVQVMAGNESDFDPPGEEAGLVRRFVASLADSGMLRLGPDGSELRILKPSGVVAHARQFLPDLYYATVASAGILRKADGTSFVIAMPIGDGQALRLSQAEYRLRLTYRRDNQSVDPQSQVLSQSGITGPEVVTIDVPWLSH
jgi:hypothetical protein